MDELLLYANFLNTAKAFSVLKDEVVFDLGGRDFLYLEDELILSATVANKLYFEGLGCIRLYRENKDFNDFLKILLDFVVLVNGEVNTAWNIKLENLDFLNIQHELHINELCIKFHRKAAIAWEFRKKLIIKSKTLPINELKVLKKLSKIHKQNYYLWEYRRWLFIHKLCLDQQNLDIQAMFKFCESHPSDSSAYHYLYTCLKSSFQKESGYEWIKKLSERYYGQTGLYNEKNPPGYETINLFRAKVRPSGLSDINYYEQQQKLSRNVKFLYKNHDELQEICFMACGGLSILGCSMIILSGLLYEKLRSYSFRMIIYLSIADLISSLCKSYSGFMIPITTYQGCLTQALAMNYSQLSSILITGVIAYSLYIMVVKENLDLASLEYKFVGFCFGVPAVITPLPLITQSYGNSHGWCWILENGQLNILWTVIEFYGPLLIIFYFNLYFYYKIYKVVWSQMDYTAETRVMIKLVKRLKIYPISLIVCFGLGASHRLFYLLGGEKNYYFDLVTGCVVGLYGFFNAIIYGLTSNVRKFIKKTVLNLLFSVDNSSSIKLI